MKVELSRAELARADGKEGMARVCARRAAGIAISQYLERQGLPQPGESAYDLLKYLSQLPRVIPQVKEVTAHFLARVNPDRSLSVEADLVAEARWLAVQLLGNDLW